MPENETKQLIKVRYFSETNEELSTREYTYYSVERLNVGDIVTVPIRDTTGKAKVSTVDVPEAEIEKFKDKVKIISAGSILNPEVGAGLAAAAQESGVQVTETIIEFTPIEDKPESTALIFIHPELDPRVIGLAVEINGLKSYAVQRVVASDSDLAPATDDLSIIAKVKKSLDEYRKEYLKPIKTHIDDVNNAFKLLSDPLDEADRINRQKIQTYRAEIARKQAEADAINQAKEALKRLEAEFSGTGEFTVDITPVEAPEQIKHVYTGMGSIGTQKVRKWEVIDQKLVPEELKIVDSARVTKMVKAGIGSISGIRIWEEETLRVTAK